MIDFDFFIREFDRLILNNNITSTEIAKELGLNKSTITNYRNCKRKLTLEMFVKICFVCKTHPASMIDECLSSQGVKRYAAAIEDNFRNELKTQRDKLKYLENRAISKHLKINTEPLNNEVQVDKKSLYLETLQYRYAIYLSQHQETLIAHESELKSIIQSHNGNIYELNSNGELAIELELYIYQLKFNDPEGLPLKDYLPELRQLICLMLFRHKLQTNDIDMSLLTHYVESRYDSIESFNQINNIKDILRKYQANSIFTAELDSLYFGIDLANTRKGDPLEDIEFEYLEF